VGPNGWKDGRPDERSREDPTRLLDHRRTGRRRKAGPWLVLQLLAIAALLATVAAAVAWWRDRHAISAGNRVRLGLLLAGGVVLVPWAVYWGLLTP
jgi:hypothetical protein